jgi:hypothetical protein
LQWFELNATDGNKTYSFIKGFQKPVAIPAAADTSTISFPLKRIIPIGWSLNFLYPAIDRKADPGGQSPLLSQYSPELVSFIPYCILVLP